MRGCGEEAGEQTSDLMDKNRVKRREASGELASDSDAQEGSKRLDVNAARVEGKLSFLSGEVSPEGEKSAAAIVVRGKKKR